MPATPFRADKGGHGGTWGDMPLSRGYASPVDGEK